MKEMAPGLMASFNRIQPSRSGLSSMPQRETERYRQKDEDTDRLQEGKAGQRLTDTHADDHVSCITAHVFQEMGWERAEGMGGGLHRVLTRPRSGAAGALALPLPPA